MLMSYSSVFFGTSALIGNLISEMWSDAWKKKFLEKLQFLFLFTKRCVRYLFTTFKLTVLCH